MQEPDIIGGEFEIAFPVELKKVNMKERGFFYSSGRGALFNVLEYIKERMEKAKILLPDYLCMSIIEVVKRLKLDVRFYRTNEDLTIDYESLWKLYDTKTSVLFINYFGLSDAFSIVKELRRMDERMCIVQDNVQAYFDMQEESGADFVFTSFRKTLPVPDGGWVKTSFSDLPICATPNSFSQYKLAGGILKSLRRYNCMDDLVYLELLEKGEKLIDQDYRNGMNDVTERMYNQIDFEYVRERRKQNTKFLLAHLEQMGIQTILPVPESAIPLFVPIRLKNRDKVRELMFQANIFCPVHWPVFSDYKLERGEELMHNELSLIVDQRYGLNDMRRIIDVLQESL